MNIRLGTRKSKLAMIQAEMVKNQLEALGHDVEIFGYTSKGDLNTDTPLYRSSTTGVFVDELNNLILDGKIDIAVHSAKDIPSIIDPNLEISGVLRRDDYHDIFISKLPLESMPCGSVIGTSSMRRIKEIQAVKGCLSIKDIRGNIDTRIKKYRNGDYDGIIIAKAAYDRLGLNENYFMLSEDKFVPAANQGIIAVVSKKDSVFSDIIREINDGETYNNFLIERDIVRNLNLGCSIPAGILSKNGKIFMRFYSLRNSDYRDFFYINNDIEYNEIREVLKEYGYA
ncbi:hydroxymethylbilane synthase [Acidiplasma aeolicum]|jgi:hydroxymethylbilane synthase|uniref:hydroxymethylbilane synthase n=1 Tax=Acidiplasma aeolicum TaxID=507754 RepID=UPI00372212D3